MVTPVLQHIHNAVSSSECIALNGKIIYEQ
jgi:hypothetical protein